MRSVDCVSGFPSHSVHLDSVAVKCGAAFGLVPSENPMNEGLDPKVFMAKQIRVARQAGKRSKGYLYG